MSENTSRTDTQHDDIKGFDDPAPKTMKWIKLLGGTAIGLVVLAGGAGIIASSMIDQQKYKSLIIEKVDEATGYKVDWQGDIGISLLPLPHVTVSDLSVEANNQQILTIKTADVEVALLPLLSKKVEIKDVTLEEPHITLVTLKDGTQSWMTSKLKKSEDKVSSMSDGNTNSNDTHSSMDISLNVVEITDGIFIWDDQSKGQRQSIEDLDVRLKADSLSGPFEVNGGMLWNGHKIEAKINTSDLDIKNGLYPVQIKLALPQNNIQTEFSGTITQKDQLNVEMYKKNINGFILDCKSTFPDEIDDSNLIRFYLQLKEHKVIKDCIHICKNLIIYKKYIENNDNLSDNFIKSSKTHELVIFPFCNFDIKFIYTIVKIDDSIKKYLLIFMNMLFNTSYDIYQIITSPDIDISNFSDIIVDSIKQAKKMIPRANKAFRKIEESVELLKDNFQNYYKDFITTKNPTIIIENFILDVSKENTGELDLDLARQFKKIVMFYQKKSQGKIKDPRINQLFEMLNKNFDMLNVKDKDVSESEESDTDSDIEIVKNVEDNDN
mgnify:CR=1 FL=1